MKKLAIFIALCMVLAFAGFASAQVSNVKEPGSLLVYPLIDNIFHATIVDMANLGDAPVWLSCYMITHDAIDPTAFEKKSFQIFLTEKQPFWWDTRRAFQGDGFRIPAFNGRKGMLFCWAINNPMAGQEIDWDELKGDALIYNGANGRAFSYNAYPHQGIAVVGDRILNLDGVEYTGASSKIYFEGFADGFSGIVGTLVLANIDNNFPASFQPEFDVGLQCYNQNEDYADREAHLQQFRQYTLTELNLDLPQVGTPKIQCAVQTFGFPLWGVFFENTGRLEWGGLVWQDPASLAATQIVLWPRAK